MARQSRFKSFVAALSPARSWLASSVSHVSRKKMMGTPVSNARAASRAKSRRRHNRSGWFRPVHTAAMATSASYLPVAATFFRKRAAIQGTRNAHKLHFLARGAGRRSSAIRCGRQQPLGNKTVEPAHNNAEGGSPAALKVTVNSPVVISLPSLLAPAPLSYPYTPLFH